MKGGIHANVAVLLTCKFREIDRPHLGAVPFICRFIKYDPCVIYLQFTGF